MSLRLHFFIVKLVQNLYDNPVLFENVQKLLLTDIMT